MNIHSLDLQGSFTSIDFKGVAAILLETGL